MADVDVDPPVRIVVTPSQSSYFAGEPFSVTITFTNTRSPDPGPSRAISHSTHRRNAHSISSAPISRPPTSPGTPRTPRTATAQPRFSRDDARPTRKGLIGRTPTSLPAPPSPTGSLPALVELRRKKMLAKSLSVSIAPLDIDLSRNSSGPRTPRSASFVPESPPSPILPVPVSRRSDTLPLAASHPHARKHSILDGAVHELVTSPISPSSSSTLPHTPSASSSTFSLPLDSISEAAAAVFPYPPPSAIPPSPAPGYPLSVFTTTNHSAPVAYPPRRNSSASQTQLGHGHPPAINTQLPIPPRTAQSASFTPPHTELLLYAYVALAGRAVLSPLAGTGTSALHSLRSSLLQPARGGGSLSLQAAGVGGGLGLGFPSAVAAQNGPRHRRSSSFSAGLRALGAGIGIWGRDSGAVPGSSQAAEDPEAPVPTLDVPPEMLAVDLTLGPGESRSYTYKLLLPAHLPPTFKGRTLRFSYELVIGACRASGGSSVMKVPIRIYNNVVVGSSPRPYDLMWPIARRTNIASTAVPPRPTVTETQTIATTMHSKSQQTGSESGSVDDLARYAALLLSATSASPSSIEILATGGDLAGVEGESGGGLRGCREAVEVLTRNLKKVSYDITKDGVTVAVLTFPKSAFRLGETVNGVVEVNWRQGRGRVLQLTALLEAHESLPNTLANPPSTPVTARYLRRVHAEHHARFVLGTLRLGFALDIPSDGSPAFGVVAGANANGTVGGLEWKVRLCLLVGVTRAESDPGTEGVRVKGLVRAGDEKNGGGRGAWGGAWRAPARLGVLERIPPPSPSPPSSAPEKSAGWGAFLAASFLGASEGGYHDGDDFDEDEGVETSTDEDEYEYDGVKSDLAGGVGIGVRYGGREEGWTDVKVEMVECVVPVRVWAGNTAFRPGDVVFNV
ncbi:Rgp1-domain-containing protein [Favolaschia claudopus]|uniref:Rgp1-domain-containing protein n=1 Tax=Favolaschia claudopus TaxID=2862362 RepID=A0AAW0E0E8_9AGAR